mmetsp:Transcript_15148/g.29913  ORF Transcript_15148/g.29913 Transcript_15148/m.29913 type:complete len:204 (+) Transcript_15148:304-915(+)
MWRRVADRPKRAILVSGIFCASTTSRRPLRVLSTAIWRSEVSSLTPPKQGEMASSFLGRFSLSTVIVTSLPVPLLYWAQASLMIEFAMLTSVARTRITTAVSIIWNRPCTVSLIMRSLYAAFEGSPILASSLDTTALTEETTSSRAVRILRRLELTSLEKAMRRLISICLCLLSYSDLTLIFSCSTRRSFSMLNSSSALMRIS